MKSINTELSIPIRESNEEIGLYYFIIGKADPSYGVISVEQAMVILISSFRSLTFEHS